MGNVRDLVGDGAVWARAILLANLGHTAHNH